MAKTKLKEVTAVNFAPKKPGDPLRLDLGCGQRRPEPKEQWGDNWIGIDISPDVGADYVYDLQKYPWPLDDESVDEAYTAHFLEHLTGPERLPFMDECWRILKAGAKMTIVVPYWSSMRAVQDPFHAWPPICDNSMLYFNKGWRDAQKLDHYPIKCDFDFGWGYLIAPELRVRNEQYLQEAVRDHVNAVWDIIFTLTRRAKS